MILLKKMAFLNTTVLKKDINKDEVIRIDDVELNLPNEVTEARNYQYNLLNS